MYLENIFVLAPFSVISSRTYRSITHAHNVSVRDKFRDFYL